MNGSPVSGRLYITSKALMPLKQTVAAGAIQVPCRHGAFAIPPHLPDIRLQAHPQQPNYRSVSCGCGGVHIREVSRHSSRTPTRLRRSSSSPSGVASYSSSTEKNPRGNGLRALGLWMSADGSALPIAPKPVKSTAQMALTIRFRGSRNAWVGTEEPLGFLIAKRCW